MSMIARQRFEALGLLKQIVVGKAESVKQPDDFSNILWICLLVTLGVDCLGALVLAGGQFLMPATLFGTLAAATLLVIGVANGWAFNSARRAGSTWARDAVIAQALVLLLAGFVIVTDARSPIINWYVMATAVLVFAVAFLWFVLLVARSRLEWTKTALILTALFPLAGLLQFWLQNYYIPSTSMPLVDISTELSPQGWTGPIIHLSAKVTLHNRGTVSATVANSVIRLTAYPLTIPGDPQVPANPCTWTPDRDQDWCRLAEALGQMNPDIDFPLNRTPPASSQLLYAGTYGDPTAFLVAGETDTFQRMVDIDSRKVRLARLSFSAIFLTQRRIADIKSCTGKHASENEDLKQVSSEVQQVQAVGVAGPSPRHYFCREYDIAPANIIDRLISSRPAMQVYTFLDNPSDIANEYPRIALALGAAGRFDRSDPDRRLEGKLWPVVPVAMWIRDSEYAPTEKPPPAPPSGNG